MFRLRSMLLGILALALLGLPAAPRSAAAQAGTRTYEVTVTNITGSAATISWTTNEPADSQVELTDGGIAPGDRESDDGS